MNGDENFAHPTTEQLAGVTLHFEEGPNGTLILTAESDSASDEESNAANLEMTDDQGDPPVSA